MPSPFRFPVRKSRFVPEEDIPNAINDAERRLNGEILETVNCLQASALANSQPVNDNPEIQNYRAAAEAARGFIKNVTTETPDPLEKRLTRAKTPDAVITTLRQGMAEANQLPEQVGKLIRHYIEYFTHSLAKHSQVFKQALEAAAGPETPSPPEDMHGPNGFRAYGNTPKPRGSATRIR